MVSGATVCLGLILLTLSATAQDDFQKCGRTLSNREIGENRVSQQAKIGEYPFMCVLFANQNGQLIFLGGASLIQENLVLTLASAAQPLLGERKQCGGSQPIVDLSVRCGSIDLQPEEIVNDYSRKEQEATVKRIIVHPGYDEYSLVNDFAILEVDTPFNYTQAVGRVCLPEPGQEIAEDIKCAATGHGRAKILPYSKELKQVNLPIWNSEKCENVLNEKFFSTKDVQDWKVHPSFLCAGEEESEASKQLNPFGFETGVKDTCDGDGGGPLVCLSGKIEGEEEEGEKEEEKKVVNFISLKGITDEDPTGIPENVKEGKFIQVGITAWGAGECGSGLPGVYSKVADARCWIEKVMLCNPRPAILDLRGTENSNDQVKKSELSSAQCAKFEIEDDDSTCGCKITYSDDLNDGLRSALFDLRRVE